MKKGEKYISVLLKDEQIYQVERMCFFLHLEEVFHRDAEVRLSGETSE